LTIPNLANVSWPGDIRTAWLVTHHTAVVAESPPLW